MTTDRAKAGLGLDPKKTDNDAKPWPPRPGDLPAFLPYACGQLGLEFDLDVTVVIEEEYVAKVTADGKRRKSNINLKKVQSKLYQSDVESAPCSSSRLTAGTSQYAGGLLVHLKCAVSGASRAVVALDVDRNGAVPRALLSLLRLCAPYNPQLTRLSARWCTLARGALHELAALLPLGNISEVRLDDTLVPADDCRALLDSGRLRCLSLARCQLGAEGCAAVAEALIYPRPASLSLVALLLAGNAVGDAGARAMARALRVNRTLRLLDLADNQLRDEGGLALLRTLSEFPLTLDEILIGRRFHIDRCAAPAPDGPPCDPFPPEGTVQRGGHMYSRGNSTLNCLNLSYNSLSMVSLGALLQALRGQAGRAGAGGLVRVSLAGNPLPARAHAYDAAAQLMERALVSLETANKQKIKKKTVLSKRL